MSSSSRRILLGALAVLLIACGVAGYALWLGSRLPGPGSPRYEQYVDAFQVGVAALDADVPQIAEENLTQAVELIPEEPAGWADRGLLYLRTSRLAEAAQDLERAQRLAPDNAAVQKLLGLLEQSRGRYSAAAAYLRRAIEQDPRDVKSLYLLGQIVEQEHTEGSDAERQRLLERILAIKPDNLRVLADHLLLAVRRADEKAVTGTLARMRALSEEWSKAAQAELANAEQKLADKLGPSGVAPVLRLANVLKAEPGYPRRAAEVSPPNSLVGDSLQTFVRLAPVRPSPSPPDVSLKFAVEALPDAPEGAWQTVLPVWLTGDGEPAVFVANDEEVRRLGSETGISASATEALTPIDWNNDRRTDLLIAGGNGLRFLQQTPDGDFDDVSDKTDLPDEAAGDDYRGALAADVDLDGDLDLILSRGRASPVFLRNNFDGTFAPRTIFDELTGPQRFVWADFDHDGAPDAALLDAQGALRVFANERSGAFIAWPAPLPELRLLAIAAADANDDGALDLIAIDADGRLLRISDRDKRSSWEVAELASWPTVAGDQQGVVDRLIAGDFDNNGAIDLLASGPGGSGLWLKDGDGEFQRLDVNLPPRVLAAADLLGEGRLDLLAMDEAGKPLRLVNSGGKDYHWQTVRPRATEDKTEGDNRINSFGIGGELELRTGTQVVKQPIAAPVVHFGLGERDRADVMRIEWPNGTFQVEFKTPIDKAVTAVQRLKGSCPFLFAFDGRRFGFVTDFMWSSPLGMYINGDDKGGFLQTTDWVKIAGERLAARDGHYELRVNANLWETHFFDHLALMAVDHADDAEMFVDERFYMAPTPPAFHLMEKPRSVALARDHNGQDALREVTAIDGVYLDRCGRGPYQGLTRDHWLEIDLGDDAPAQGPLWLVARGWIHPTDSSINYALAQGRHEPPRALTLEAPDGQGGWKTLNDRLGFPSGKNKALLVRLDGLNGQEVTRRFRLRTNMEIYWDWLAYARGKDDAAVVTERLLLVEADLRFRGIVAMTEANRSSPELPDYDRVVACGQHWRDLIGYHTRHGDIRELLKTVDDRYAILTAGDEIVLRFKAPPGPAAGKKRDFVWVSDGWVKDGDYNTRFGKTVLPLPAHDLGNYNAPPGALTDDPAYRRHPGDWEAYHTRYITPHVYERGLRPK